ncbi:MAG: hypothetical protein H6R02_3004 [Burkholderiaceae bacterium]|jgi:hypothetical protein|nr:hypothetical protein [Burkholderiaceae bacterium]
MKTLGSIVLAASAAAVMVACTWKAPMSEVTGDLYSRVNKDLFATGILTVDGESTYTKPTVVTPGRHVLRVQGLGPNWADAVKEMTVDFEPCKRYYIAAYRPAAASVDWEPRVDVILPISGCPKAATPVTK